MTYMGKNTTSYNKNFFFNLAPLRLVCSKFLFFFYLRSRLTTEVIYRTVDRPRPTPNGCCHACNTCHESESRTQNLYVSKRPLFLVLFHSLHFAVRFVCVLPLFVRCMRVQLSALFPPYHESL